MPCANAGIGRSIAGSAEVGDSAVVRAAAFWHIWLIAETNSAMVFSVSATRSRDVAQFRLQRRDGGRDALLYERLQSGRARGYLLGDDLCHGFAPN